MRTYTNTDYDAALNAEYRATISDQYGDAPEAEELKTIDVAERFKERRRIDYERSASRWIANRTAIDAALDKIA